MKKFIGPLSSRLGLLFIALLLLFSSRSGVIAADEDHGNPGHFIENIRKGLSGISKYFWSPKASTPNLQTATEPADRKIQKLAGGKDVTPSKTLKSDKKTTPVQVNNKITKTVSKPIAKIKSAKVESEQDKVNTELRAIAKKAKKPASERMLAKPSGLEKNITESKKKIKKPGLIVLKKDAVPSKQQKSVVQKKQIKAIAKVTKQDKPLQSSAKGLASKAVIKKPAAIVSTLRKKAQNKTSLKADMLPRHNKKIRMALATGKSGAQVLSRNNIGTYIWMPNMDSPLSSQYGISGVSAHQLAANGDLNRTDGRWIFVPKKNGVRPGLYGLQTAIRSAREGGAWIGSRGNWLYVFDRKRTYASFVEGYKKTAKKTQQAKVAVIRSEKTSKIADQKELDGKVKVTRKKAPEQAAKLAAVHSLKSHTSKDKKNTDSKSSKATKTDRNGNWSKVKGNWVYKPVDQSERMASTNIEKLAKKAKSASSTGGWVQRNKRWVYVNPTNNNAAPDTRKARSTNQDNSVKNDTGKNLVEKIVPAKSITLKKQTSGLAEGLDVAAKNVREADKVMESATAKTPSKATSNQKVWVRKNNRWVFASRKIIKSPRSSHASVMVQEADKTQINRASVKKQRARLPQGKEDKQGDKRAAKMNEQEFYFFVPGNVPGTGNWFAAPLQMLKKARKLHNPAQSHR